MHKIELWEG